MVDFARNAATAKRMIEARGRVVRIVKLNRDPDDSTKPWRGTAGRPEPQDGGVSFRIKMVFVPVGSGGLGKLIGDAAPSVDVDFSQAGLIATDSIPSPYGEGDIEKADLVIDGDDEWKIVTRGHLKPGDTSILFALGLTK